MNADQWVIKIGGTVIGLLVAIVIGMVGYFGSGAVKAQSESAARQTESAAGQIKINAEINEFLARLDERGQRNRDDILEMKQDSKAIAEAVYDIKVILARRAGDTATPTAAKVRR